MVECSEAREILFQKLLEKLGSYKIIVPSIACNAKMEYSWFFSTVVKKNNDEFLSCKKEGDRLDRLDRFIYGDILQQKVNLVG